jgi:FkbM family methyltransferase
VNATLKFARRAAGALYRRVHPSPEAAALRRIESMVGSVPRRTPGRIRVLEYDIEYCDLISFWPQFDDIFVRHTLDFQSRGTAPRILDCGANIGAASLFFKRRYPAARVTAYEADAALCEMTRRNLARNGARDVEVVHAALWTSTGEVAFRAEGSDSGMIDGLAGAVDATRVTVPSLRLRDVLERERIDFLKLDIEGAEGAVLEDCEPVLGNVDTMVLDLHEFDPADRQSPRVFECLRRAGFLYSCEHLVPQPSREPVAGESSPFPKLPLVWTLTVKAWRR